MYVNPKTRSRVIEYQLRPTDAELLVNRLSRLSVIASDGVKPASISIWPETGTSIRKIKSARAPNIDLIILISLARIKIESIHSLHEFIEELVDSSDIHLRRLFRRVLLTDWRRLLRLSAVGVLPAAEPARTAGDTCPSARQTLALHRC